MKKNPSRDCEKNSSSSLSFSIAAGKTMRLRCLGGTSKVRPGCSDYKESRALRLGPLCGGLLDPVWLPVNQIVEHDEVGGAAGTDVVDGGAKRAGAEGDANPRDDRVGVRHGEERQSGGVRANRRRESAQARAVQREQLDGGLVGGVDITEDDAKSA